MAVMQCDICGNALTMDVSGEFAICEFCGIKHPKQRLLNKISCTPEIDESADSSAVEEREELTFKDEPVGVDVSGFSIDEPHIENEKIEEIEVNHELLDEEVHEESVADNTSEELYMDTLLSDSIVETEQISLNREEDNVIETLDVDGFDEVEDTVVSSESDIDYLDDEPVLPPPIVGAMDIGMDADDGYIDGESSGPVIVSSASENVEEMENEKKQERIEELKNELAEFEEMYESNKNKFLGEGLKKKNYSEAKIKEIREKLQELGVEVAVNVTVAEENPVLLEVEPEYEVEELDVEEMSQGEREEYERKVKRVQDLKEELQEFKDIYEANKGQFFGEGLKRKNYSETKIKEIREKLVELTS